MLGYSSRNRNSGRGGYNHSASTRSYNVPSPDRDDEIINGIKQPALQILKAPTANPADWPAVQPRGLTPVASYNWTNRKPPTIIVPGMFYYLHCCHLLLIFHFNFVMRSEGCPPIWQNTPPPFKLPRDSERPFIDQNRYRVPQYPLLPMFTAIERMQPSFDYASLDIITDRNNLRKLLKWIEGSSQSDFRIDLQLCGENTVVLGRWESKPVETNPWKLGYGMNFEKYTTRLLAGCEESTAHHRIISYVCTFLTFRYCTT